MTTLTPSQYEEFTRLGYIKPPFQQPSPPMQPLQQPPPPIPIQKTRKEKFIDYLRRMRQQQQPITRNYPQQTLLRKPVLSAQEIRQNIIETNLLTAFLGGKTINHVGKIYQQS